MFFAKNAFKNNFYFEGGATIIIIASFFFMLSLLLRDFTILFFHKDLSQFSVGNYKNQIKCQEML